MYRTVRRARIPYGKFYLCRDSDGRPGRMSGPGARGGHHVRGSLTISTRCSRSGLGPRSAARPPRRPHDAAPRARAPSASYTHSTDTLYKSICCMLSVSECMLKNVSYHLSRTSRSGCHETVPGAVLLLPLPGPLLRARLRSMGLRALRRGVGATG